MSQIICKLKDGQTIDIELLNNPFMFDFIEQFKKVNHNLEFDQEFFNPCGYENRWSQKRIEIFESKIKEAIRNLNFLGVNFPIAEDEIQITNDSNGRDLLNRLHRHFTTGHRSASETKNFIWLENSNLTFSINEENYNEFAKWTHQINDYVHQSEPYFINSRKLNFPMTKEYLILYKSMAFSEQNFNYFCSIKQEHYEYFSDDMHFDVWLPLNQIQGKNYLQGYIDEDNPIHWDISSNIFYSGSFSIGDRGWYHNEEIQNYLKSYGIETGPHTCGMPLGKIIKGRELIPSLTKNKIIAIDYNE
jgi:hypothetical protein